MPNTYGVWTANENDVEGNAGGFLLSSVTSPVLNGNWAELNGGPSSPNNYSGPAYTGKNYGF